MRCLRCGVSVGVALAFGALPSVVTGAIKGHHAFSWWDDPLGTGTVVVLPKGAPGPVGGTHLLDLEEWHLDCLIREQLRSPQSMVLELTHLSHPSALLALLALVGHVDLVHSRSRESRSRHSADLGQ